LKAIETLKDKASVDVKKKKDYSDAADFDA